MKIKGILLSGALAFSMLACQNQGNSTEDAANDAPAASEKMALEAKKEVVAEAPKEAGSTDTVMAAIGEKAPDFELKGLDGKVVKLSDFAGKMVVLEWFNPDCPFVVYAHGEGPLKSMPKAMMTAHKDLVWLAINSGAEGKQGHGVERNKKALEEYGMNYVVLSDEDGKVGKQFGAKTTPHMFVINKEGELAYSGALDNSPMGRKTKGEKEINYVQQALTSIAAGKAVETSSTKPYGCSVKYGS